MGRNIAYILSCMDDLNEERQRALLDSYGIDKWFVENSSGRDVKRPQLLEMLECIRDGDAIYIERFSRLGRSTADLLSIVQIIKNSGARLVSIKESFDTDTPLGKLQLGMIVSIAEFEREMVIERRREGIALAKQAGKYKGRKRINIPNIGEYYDLYMTRKRNKTQLAAELGISRNTLDRLFKEYESLLQKKNTMQNGR